MGEKAYMTPATEHDRIFEEMWNTPAEGESSQTLFDTEIDPTWFADESANFMQQLTARAYAHAGD